MAKLSVPKITYSRKGEEQGLIYESTNPPTYDELLGKIAGMSYESPIDIVVGEMQFKFEQDVMKAIQSYDICVDRDELIKALQYDRHQYEKGFADACKLNTKGEWISVEDRLPEATAKQITICDQDIRSGEVVKETVVEAQVSNTVVVVCKRHLYGKFEQLLDLDHTVDGQWVNNMGVTHWMPLPEAPKMKGGAE